MIDATSKQCIHRTYVHYTVRVHVRDTCKKDFYVFGTHAQFSAGIRATG